LPEAGQFEEWVVADIIGYPETSMVTRRVDDDEKTNLPLRQDGSNCQTNITIINEAGL
jgi:prophage antirepressor-like protein